LLPVFCDDLVALLSPAGIVARNEQKSRVKEGLPLETRVLQGDIPDEVEFEEDGISFCVSLLKGQKTGGYVDQRDNHIALRRLLEGRPPMASALDIFSYQGGFAMHLGRVADRVLAVDSSADALVNLTRNAALNGIETIDTVEANAFDWLKAESQSARRHGCIVLDPPAFAKRASEVLRAASAYKEINLRAMKVLAPGGILATSTCSQHIDDAMFLDILREASVDARQEFRLIERRGQGADHPVLLTVPETRYLSCMFLEMVS